MVNPLSAATDGLISPDYLVLEIASEGLLIFEDTPIPPTPTVTGNQERIISLSEPRQPVSGALDENELISEEEEMIAIINAFLSCQN